jgi:hypothetical protein
MSAQNVEFVGLDRVFAGFSRIEKRLVSLKPLWERFGREFYRQETAWFASEPWTPLSPEYAERKRKEFGSKPLLRATDALFKSLTQEGAEGNIHQVNDLGAQFGSNDFKAKLHSTGTSRMPAREPLAEPDVNRYETIAGQYINEMMSEAGFH